MSVSVNRVWRQLPEEIRITACKTFWAEAKGAEKQFLFASLARAKNLREVTVRKAPIDRLATWTAFTLTLPDQIVEDVLKRYLLHDHRPVIINFLELLKIPHTEGMIEEEFDMESLAADAVQQAARELLNAEDRTGAEIYLTYLVLQGGPWAAIEAVLPQA